MKLDYSARASGKTTRMIQTLREHITCYLITISTREEQRLRHAYPDVAHRIFYWETWLHDLRSGQRMGMHGELLVDNADMVLERMLGKYVRSMSMTKEEIMMREVRDQKIMCCSCGKVIANAKVGDHGCDNCNASCHPKCIGEVTKGSGEHPDEDRYSYCKKCTKK